MLQLVDKLSTLVGQMQKFLDRPAQVIYQSGGPAREGGKGGGGKRTSRNISDAQNSTLKDIFQNNLDLRRSLAKLAETVTPPAARSARGNQWDGRVGGLGPRRVVRAGVPAGQPERLRRGAPVAARRGATAGAGESADFDGTALADGSADEPGHDVSMRVHDGDRARHAQPAA